MIKRRKIGDRYLSSLRPDIRDKADMNAQELVGALRRFADEYLRSALELTVNGDTAAVANISLEGTAYLLRLLVECGSEASVLRLTLALSEYMTFECEYPSGQPSIDFLSKIAAAGREAGFHFEVRGSRIILRTRLNKTGKLPIYSDNTDKFLNCFKHIFFD